MQAIVCPRYGPPEVLELREVPTPTPGPHDVLIRVQAASVTSGDVRVRSFTGFPPLFWLPGRLMFGVRRPRHAIPGSELAGEVTAVGTAVTRWQVGDQVFGMTGLQFGANAEYLCLPQTAVLALRPSTLTPEQAAAVPFGALTALFFLRGQAQVQRGQRVLINGAGGGVGVYAVQLARQLGAQVTAVCSTGKVELVRELGADEVIDYTQTDFTRGAARYDVIFDTVGTTTFGACRRALNPHGVYLLLVFGAKQMAQMLWTKLRGGPRVCCAVTEEKADDLAYLRDLLATGALRPVIDRTYPLAQAVAAHRYVEQGHKAGGLVLTLPLPRGN